MILLLLGMKKALVPAEGGRKQLSEALQVYWAWLVQPFCPLGCWRARMLAPT